MEELAMLRQFIGQVQELLQLYASPSDNHYFLQLQLHPPPPPPPPPSPPLLHHPRWCFLDFEDPSIKDNRKSSNLRLLDPGKPPPLKKPKNNRNNYINTPTEMNPNIWKEFPEDLFESVLARCQIPTFFHLKSVSKKFNSILNTQSFITEYNQLSKFKEPWFYTITHENVNTGAIYSPANKRWLHPTFSALPRKFIVLPVASSGGLICFLDIGHRSFYVSNPITKSFKELPPRSVKVWAPISVSMSEKSNGQGYKILWVGCNGEYEVYDSDTNHWVRGNIPLTINIPLGLNFRSQAVTILGNIYFMRSDPDGIVCYEVDTGVWTEIIIPLPGKNISDYGLAESNGKLMLVGLLSKNAVNCVLIWELEKMTVLWKEVDRMPNEWCLEFYGKHVRMSCIGNKGLIMLSLRSRQMNRLVTYDLLRKEWVKVPSCVLPRGRKKQWIACGTMFYPSLTAKA